MSVENKVPAIRFKGASGEWEERRLETIFNKIRNAFVGTATPFYVKSGNFYLESNNIKDGKINRKNEVFINDEFYKKQSDKWLRTGDIVMVQSGHVGHTAVIPPELNNIAAHALIMFAESKEKVNPYFLNFQFQTIKSKHQLSEITTGNTIKHILSSEMKEYEVLFTHIKEQTKIGHYFQQLDTLIAQHQQKHDKLLNLKKSLLEKMFPKQGADVPEIRFKGGSGKWGKRNWLDTVDISTNMVDPRNGVYADLFHIGPGNIESFSGKIYDNVLKVKDSYLISGKFHFNKGDVIYGKINPQLAKHIIAPFEGLASADTYVLNTKNGVVKNYLYVILQTKEFYKYSVSVSARTGMPKINRDELNIYSYKAPDKAEQTKIGNLFKQLDILINQHQIQLKKLNKIKQACLAKMFV